MGGGEHTAGDGDGDGERGRDPTAGTKTHPSHAHRVTFIRQNLIPVLIGKLFDEENVQAAERAAEQNDLLILDVAGPISAGIIDDIAAGKRAHPLWRASDV